MSTSADTMAEILRGFGLVVHEPAIDRLEFGLPTRSYSGPDGVAGLHVVVDVLDDGRFVRVMAPGAFVVGEFRRDLVVEACLRFQWAYRLVRIEFDHTTGELRPSVHLPVLDGFVTDEHLRTAVGAVGAACETLHELLEHVLTEGRIPDVAFSTSER